MKKIKKILNWVSYVLMGIVLLFIVYVVITSATKKEVSIFGRKMFVIKTDSMEPTIEVGTVIMIKEDDYTNLDKGTIITFDFGSVSGIPNTHRIVGYYYEYKDENGEIKYDSTYDYGTINELMTDNPEYKVIGYRTQGDNPEKGLDQRPVKFDSIRGVYVKEMVIITFLYGLLSTFWGFLLIILIPLLVILFTQIVSMYKNRQKYKMEKEIKEKEQERKEIEEKIKEEAIKEFIEKNKE